MKECVGPKEEESRLNDAGTFTARQALQPDWEVGKLQQY
jgi:hypothetical protein